MAIIGYARVSTDGQSLAAQEADLKAAGAIKVFSEKASGAKTDRAALTKAIAAIGQGDVLVVTRLDRLARSTRDLLNMLDGIGKAGAGFKSLADTWADTTTPHGRLMLTVEGAYALPMSDADRATFHALAGGRAVPSRPVKDLSVGRGRIVRSPEAQL